ncbi:hypothetical protein [Nocardioides sp. HB32]
MSNLPAVQNAPTASLSVMPTDSEFDSIVRQAQMLARSTIVPKSYQSQINPNNGHIIKDGAANVVVAALTGRTFGWDALTAMRNIHVIEGTASLKPEAMLGMIRGRGHSVSIQRGDDRVTVTGKRADTGDTLTVTFSFDDAYRAGLCTRGQDGRPVAKSSNGGVKPWQAYPIDMCQWRAVGALARGLFGDVVLGLGYSPEELGANVTADGNIVEGEVAASQVTPVERPEVLAPDLEPRDLVSVGMAKSALVHAAGGDVELASKLWNDAGLPSEKNERVDTSAVDPLLDRARRIAAVDPADTAQDDVDAVDAELVEDEVTEKPLPPKATKFDGVDPLRPVRSEHVRDTNRRLSYLRSRAASNFYDKSTYAGQEATKDVRWLLAEVDRLTVENATLQDENERAWSVTADANEDMGDWIRQTVKVERENEKLRRKLAAIPDVICGHSSYLPKGGDCE